MAEQMSRTILITGGAGFIGSNLAERLLAEPATRVRIFDNLSRGGVDANLEWLHSLDGADRLEFINGDVRNAKAVASAARHVNEIYHLAAQVAVTTSVDDPRTDFDINVGGTLNVLEAARLSSSHPFVLFTSTNKVYGSLHGVPVEIDGTHYRASSRSFNGVTEDEPLDFHSPYGCSKGAADQYVRDYARIYNLPTVVFRMSCIAGPRQFGTEDQGWVAHFLYSTLEHKPITVYGDGFQVRDVLHVYDLLDAMNAVRTHLPRTAGEIYNLGGGLSRAVSVIEMLEAIERSTHSAPSLRYSQVRPGDQPLYIADTARLSAHTGWQPYRSLTATLEDIHAFWRTHRGLLRAHNNRLHAQELVGEVA
jgi:CDP-paratose 2-epimerase